MKKYFAMSKKLVFLMMISFILSSCAGPQLKKSHEIVPPEPIYGNSGEFMSPYTEDDILADWVDKAIGAKAGAQIGAAIGAYAGAKALEMVPFIGGMIGKYAGEQIGRQIAISASGGMEYITSTSDLSFDSLDKMSVYLYAKHSTHEHYQDALAATMEIYPDLKKTYMVAIYKASADAPDAAEVAKIRAMQEQKHDDELEKQEDEEVVKATVRTLQTDGSVIETPMVRVVDPASPPQTAIAPTGVTVTAISKINSAQDDMSQTENRSIEVQQMSSKNQPVKMTSTVGSGQGTIISEKIVIEPNDDKEKIDIETSTDVNEASNRSEHAGSYGTTTSKITTITTVKTVTTPGKKTVIYREVQQ